MAEPGIIPQRSSTASGAMPQPREPMTDLGQGYSPRVDPLSYPGQYVDTSSLVRPQNTLDLTLRAGRRLGQARVRLDSAGLPGDERLAGTDVPLDYALLRFNETPVNSRYPVLAIGASPSPAFLRELFDRPGRSLAIPLARAQVTGMGLGFAACVNKWGYIPVTPIVGSTESCEPYVMWLDDHHLRVLDERSQDPSFERVLVPRDNIRVDLPESGEELSACHVYFSSNGYLADSETGEHFTFGPQSELLEHLLARSRRLRDRFGRNPQEWVKVASQVPTDESAELLKLDAWVRPPQIELEGLERGHWPTDTYVDIVPSNVLSAGAFRVHLPLQHVDRNGQSVIGMNPSDAATLGSPSHVSVQPAFPGRISGMEAIAMVVLSEHVDDRSVAVDQRICDAIGVTVGEAVTLRSVVVRRRRWPDLFIGRPNYIMARAQAADLAAEESDVCLIDPLTLEMLGVESGEDVVIEGSTGDSNVIPQVRIKAYATSPEIQRRRRDLDGGDFGAHYPSVRDALGVYPDLPWIFLDNDTRRTLNLRTKLAPVRVKSSRSYQLRRELREMMLLLGIAFIGVLQIITDPATQVGVLVLLVLLVGVSIMLRMRGRLSQRAGVTPEQATGIASPRRPRTRGQDQ